jgi:hypothetical protein
MHIHELFGTGKPCVLVPVQQPFGHVDTAQRGLTLYSGMNIRYDKIPVLEVHFVSSWLLIRDIYF